MSITTFLNNNYSEVIIRRAETIADINRKKKEDKIIRIKSNKADDGGFVISAKVLDEFNYVSHAKIILDINNEPVKVVCDCKEGRKGSFCEHTAALIIKYFNVYEIESDRKTPSTDNGPADDHADKTVSDISAVSSEKGNDHFCDDEPSDIDFPNEFDRNDFFLGLNVPEMSDEPEDIYDSGDLTDDDDEEVPFTPSSCGMKILLGKNAENDEDVFWYPNDTEKLFHINTGIIGTMGTGKTQFTKSLVTQIYRERRNNFGGESLGILIFDYKGDYNEDKPDFVNAVRARIIKPYKMPYNPLSLNLKRGVPLLPLHTANAFTDTVGKIYDLGGKQRGILLECIKEAYAVSGISIEDEKTWRKLAPTFQTVYNIFKRDYGDKDSGLLGIAMTKLNDLMVFEPEPQKALPLMELLKGVVVFDISGYDADIQNLVVALTIDHFYSQMQALGSSNTDGRFRAVRKLILVDEADNFMRGRYPSLSKIMKEGREFGVGVILSTQSLEHFSGASDDYSKYILTWAVHNTSDMSRRNVEYVFKLDQKDSAADDAYVRIKKLQKHFSIVKISNDPPLMIRDRSFWELMEN